MRDFLQNVKILPPLVGECEKEHFGRCNRRISRDKEGIIFLSRYRDNIYICFLNLGDFEIMWAKLIISRLLHAIRGIKLKWEKHDTVVWGEGALRVEVSGLSLRRKGVPLMLGSPSPEWDN